MTECSTQLDLDFYKKSDLRVDFSGGDLTSDAGLLLVAQADERLGLCRALASCIGEWRQPGRIRHTLEDQIRQRIYQIAAGYEDADDCDLLRSDWALKVACGRLPSSEGDLASQPTMSRLENQVMLRELRAMMKQYVEAFIASFESAPHEIVLDIDGWDDPTHGEQQLSLFHGYYDQHMYYPVQVSDAKSGRPILVVLRAGNSPAGKGCAAYLRWLFWRLRKAFPQSRVILRGDCGFSLPELMLLCERSKVGYVLGISSNEVLKRKAQYLQEMARLQFLRTGKKARLFDDVYYAASTWAEPRRVLFKAEHLPLGPNLRFVVTDQFDDPGSLYDDFYVMRGEECENRIKEFKRGLKADRLSCHRFEANQLRLVLHQAAYWLLLEIRRAAKGTVFEKTQVEGLRSFLIKLGARINQSARRVWVRIASACPHQQIIALIARRLRACPG